MYLLIFFFLHTDNRKSNAHKNIKCFFKIFVFITFNMNFKKLTRRVTNEEKSVHFFQKFYKNVFVRIQSNNSFCFFTQFVLFLVLLTLLRNRKIVI